MAQLEEIVVVGASLGGLRSVEALRREGYGGRLTLVGEEPHFPPYDRPPLSKEVLLGEWELERARLRMAPDLDVELMLGRKATALDVDASEIALDDGSTRSFDGLVIATGAAPRSLPIVPEDLDGVYVLRTVEESVALRDALQPGVKVVVIGAGWIGAEVAAVCRARGLDVCVLEALTAPMVRGLGETLGAWAAELHRSHGVDLRLGATIASVVERDGRVAGVLLGDDSLVPADVLVVAVGVAPCTEWLVDSGLTIDNGVACDETGRARDADHVVAVGDVACWYNPLFRRDLRVEHWSNAVEQADWAARTLLRPKEEAEPYSVVPYFWSDQYGKKIQYVGVSGEFAGVVEGGLDEERFVAVFTSGEQLVGALCVNWPVRTIRYRRLIGENVGPSAIESILPAK